MGEGREDHLNCSGTETQVSYIVLNWHKLLGHNGSLCCHPTVLQWVNFYLVHFPGHSQYPPIPHSVQKSTYISPEYLAGELL